MFHSIKHKLLWIVLLVFMAINHVCFANTLQTQLSNDRITMGDTTFVTYILDDNLAKNLPDFSVLEKDFQILHTDYGNAVNMVNGVTSTQTLWRLELAPKKAGELIIPEIKFGSEKSTAQKIIVTAKPVSQSVQNTLTHSKQDAPVFLRGEISSTTPYVQSQVIYTLKLYFRTQLTNPRIEMPQIQNVTFMQLEDHPGYQTKMNGTVYNVIEKSFALFPKQAGTITISPIQFHAFAIDNNVNALNGVYNFDDQKPVSVATRDFNLSVRDVPSNYKGSTWLPAKDISLTEQWSDNTTHWQSGTPVTRTITVVAQGLRADQLPDLTIDKINGVNVYVDRPKRSNTIQNKRVVGVLEQQVTYIPNNTHSFTLPALRINWWNTQTDTNASTQLDGKTVEVATSAGTSTTVIPAAAIPIIATETPHETRAASQAFYKSIWFWMAGAFFIAWMMTLWLLKRRKTVTTHSSAAQPPISSAINEKKFEQACESSHAMLAQQYLLLWAKNQWPNVPLNLVTLGEYLNDELFKQALRELEQVLYAKTTVAWNGHALLTAFKRIKKSCQFTEVDSVGNNKGPLPPLYL